MYKVAAVDRAFSLLEVMAQHPDLGVTELAERTGNTKSLVFRLLYTLEQRGYVHKNEDARTYRLGYRSLFLAEHARRQSALIAAAGPVLDDLALATRENALLVVREELQSICVAMRESPQPLRLFAQVGKYGPLHAGGGPRVLLAFAPEAVQRAILEAPLEGFTTTTITDRAELAYSAAKAGLLSLTRSLATEYGPRGIRANMVSPGTIRTRSPSWQKRLARDPGVFEKLARWYPVGCVGEPADIAAAVAFLAADEAAFINGANLVVDGGLTAGLAPMIDELTLEACER